MKTRRLTGTIVLPALLAVGACATLACSVDTEGLFSGGSSGTAGSSTGGAGGSPCCPDASSGGQGGGISGSSGTAGSGTGGSCTNCGGGGAGGQNTGGGGSSSTGGGGQGGGGPTCGNDAQESGEVCDGTDLNGNTCGTVPGGFTGGTLACLGDCSGFNTNGCTLPPPTCQAGQLGSPGKADNVTASGAIETGFYMRFADGTFNYSAMVPTQYNFPSKMLPAQIVLYGKEGIQYDLNDDAAPVAMPFYLVDLSTLPSPQCDGVGLKTQACLEKVAKSFRCTHAPYNEAFDCPPPVTFTAQGPDDFYQDLTAGHHMLLVDITCQ